MESAELEITELRNKSLSQLDDDDLISEPSFHLKMVTMEKAFSELAPHWQQLAIKTDTTIFMTHEWAKTWWKNFGENKQRELAILTIWDDHQLIGLAPFYIGYSTFG